MKHLILLTQAIGSWFLLIPIAILNAGVREKILLPWLGFWSLPLSGLSLSLLIFLVTLALIPLFSTHRSSDYFWIGGLWLICTLGFEFLFGHYGLGKSWREILTIFDLTQGNLMILVLLSTFFSPHFAARLRGSLK